MSSQARVLVVDDEPVVTHSCRRILAQQGYGVETAGNGHDGLSRARSKHFDLVVTDLRMPDLGGMELLHTLKKEQPQTPVIVITGYGTASSVAEATSLGAFAYLHKPFTPSEMTDAVVGALSEVEAEPARAFGGILVPSDLSPGAEEALPWAELLSARLGAPVGMAYSVPLPAAVADSRPVSRSDADSLYHLSERTQEVKRRMADIALGALHSSKAKIELAHALDPSWGIIDCAKDGNYDLIAMATHARTGLARLLLGSETAKVVRNSPVPVLCVGQRRDRTRREPHLKRVLCLTDLTERSASSLRLAFSLGKTFGAELDVLHVTQGGKERHRKGDGLGRGTGNALREELASFVGRLNTGDRPVSCHLKQGRLKKCVQRFAALRQADLIVMAGDERHALSPHGSSSCAMSLVHHCVCPVLVCPPDYSLRTEDAPGRVKRMPEPGSESHGQQPRPLQEREEQRPATQVGRPVNPGYPECFPPELEPYMRGTQTDPPARRD